MFPPVCHVSCSTPYNLPISSTQTMENVGNMIDEPAVPYQAHGKIRPTILSATSGNMAINSVKTSGPMCQSYGRDTFTSTIITMASEINLIVKTHPRNNLLSGTRLAIICHRSMDNIMH